MKTRKRKRNLETKLLSEWGRLDKMVMTGYRGKRGLELRKRKSRIGSILSKLERR
jgi:hypothetical protein